jgi:hypothetical protein
MSIVDTQEIKSLQGRKLHKSITVHWNLSESQSSLRFSRLYMRRLPTLDVQKTLHASNSGIVQLIYKHAR